MNTLKGDIQDEKENLTDKVNLRDARTNKNLKTELTKLRSNRTRWSNKLAKIDGDPTPSLYQQRAAVKLRRQVADLEEEVEENMEKRIKNARSTNVGTLRLIMGGLDELEEKYNDANKETNNLPDNDLVFFALKLIEIRGRGHFCHKHTGTEQMNGNKRFFWKTSRNFQK